MRKIAIHSVPRSGSTWLGTIFNSHPEVIYKFQPLFSYPFKNYLDTNSSKKEIEDFFLKIEKSNDAFINQKEGIEKGIIPKFLKNKKASHICYKEVRYHHILDNLINNNKDIIIILLIRNPLAVIYSWMNAPKEFKKEKGWVFEEEWLDAPSKNLNKVEEYNGFNKWKEATYLFLKLKREYPDNVRLVTYSELLENTEKVVEDLFQFSNLSFDIQTINFLKNSKSKNQEDAYSVFKIKKEDKDWVKLPESIKNFIKRDLKGTKLEIFLDGK